MTRLLARTIVCAAVYGFSCGLVHSVGFGLQNLVKFPLLILVTAAICAFAWWVFSIFIARGLTFATVQRISLLTFHDTAVMLLSLTPVTLFLALTIEKPVAVGILNEYPFFLELNVFFIAVCGTMAVARQALRLIRGHGITLKRGAMVVFCWLAISLAAGGQCAWYFRPYFGLAFERNVPFMEGAKPDYRGATSIYEAIYHLVKPPTER